MSLSLATQRGTTACDNYFRSVVRVAPCRVADVEGIDSSSILATVARFFNPLAVIKNAFIFLPRASAYCVFARDGRGKARRRGEEVSLPVRCIR